VQTLGSPPRSVGPGARADAIVLDALTPIHLVYRIGMQLVATAVSGVVVVYRDPDARD
jgi:hypothetical protein